MAIKKDMSVDFRVDRLTDFLSGWVWRHQGMAIKLGRLESRWFGEALSEHPVVRPVFIAGLARSGTTILLEFFASLRGVATHRYRDFPFVHIPLWWNRFLDLVPRKSSSPVERSHRDGIFVTPESPEAMEEVLWMSFFPDCHDISRVNVLDGRTINCEFEDFFKDHIRKMLLVRGGSRYVSKGNYNITRLEYLLKLFPDARFVIPVRNPSAHIASLMKQQRIFSRGLSGNLRGRDYLRRAGHFEFGPDRQPINPDKMNGVFEVASLWNAGEELRGWARYWGQIHHYIANLLESNPKLREATIITRFEELCRTPQSLLRRIMHHCCFEPNQQQIDCFAKSIRLPAYYKSIFSTADQEIILEETADAAMRINRLCSSGIENSELATIRPAF